MVAWSLPADSTSRRGYATCHTLDLWPGPVAARSSIQPDRGPGALPSNPAVGCVTPGDTCDPRRRAGPTTRRGNLMIGLRIGLYLLVVGAGPIVWLPRVLFHWDDGGAPGWKGVHARCF